MSKSCVRYPQCRNLNGELVDSQLFKNMLEYSSNDRKFAKQMYALAKNQDFISSYRSKLEFDENGEPTMRSLFKAAKISLKDEKILKVLNKELGAGEYSWEEAFNKVKAFNENESTEYSRGTEYMATATPTSKGKYHVHAVKRDAGSESQLHSVVKTETMRDRLINLLKSYGIGVDFLDRGHNKYSTESVQKAADGLYHLIQIVQGKTDVSPVIAEEAGHAAIAMLGSSPLVSRLIDALSPEVQKQILGEEYNNKYLGRDARREVAGDLVGKALLKRMSHNKLGNLVNRIADLAKRVFYRMKADEVNLIRIDAERMADRIARGFINHSSQFNLENALQTPETLYSTEYSAKIKTYKTMLTELQLLSTKLKAANSKWADRVDVMIAKMQINREDKINQQIGILADTAALEGIAETVDMIIEVLSNDLPELLASVDFNNTYDFTTNMARNGRSLREAHLIISTCAKISALLADEKTGISKERVTYADTITGEPITKVLSDMYAIIAKAITPYQEGSFYHQLMDKEKEFFIKFLEDSYGATTIRRSTRIVFDRRLAKEQERSFIAFREGRDYTMKELVESLEQDINFFDRFLGAMADSGDIPGEIVDKTVKQYNKEADDLTNKIWDDLRAIEAQALEGGIKDPQVIYERDPKTGKLTGNLIDPLLWGIWERDYEEFMKKHKQSFLEEQSKNPSFTYKSELEKTLLWQQYFEPIRKAWHKGHSTFRPDSGWIPMDSKYHNYEYDKLAFTSPAAISLLKEIMSLKELLDSMTGNAMPSHRAPQFKGTFFNSIRNKGSRLNPKSYGSVWWDIIKDSFVTSEEDAEMYGSTLTYNSPEEDMFANRLAFEKEKINRVPLFGINRLKDMDMLSTDIYSSMLAYAGMATRYAAASQVIDTIEIGKEVLRKRKLGTEDETEGDGVTRAFTRYCKYVDKQLYGIGNKPIVIGKVVLNKIASGLSSLASKIFLGGNVPGGIVNLGTGKIETLKEAIAGEHFDMKDLLAAEKYYLTHVPQLLLQVGKTIKNDELSLIMRHFNMQNNNREVQRKYSTYKGRLHHVFDEALLFPYTSGDHYMQTVPYLALLHKQRLIAKDGSDAGNLLELYTKEAITYIDSAGFRSKNKKYGGTIALQGVYFKTEEDRQEYLMLESIAQALENTSTGIFGTTINLSTEQLDFLSNKGWNVADVENTKKLVLREMQNVQWNSVDESVIMDKAREIDDRLHGIYNEADKTALHQEIWGSMILAMRGYALGLIQRRFGASKYSVVLGGEVEGSMLTFAKLFASVGTNRWNLKDAISTLVWPWTKGARAKMEAAGFTTNQYRNIRRTWADFLGIILLKLLRAACADDEDEKETEEEVANIVKQLKANGAPQALIDSYIEETKQLKEIDPMGVAYYFLSRWEREQSAFSMANAMYEEWQNLTSLVPAGLSVVWNLGELVVLLGGDIFFNYQEIDPEKYEMLKKAGWSKEMIAAERQRDQEALNDAAGQHFFYGQTGPDGIYKKGEAKWKRKLSLLSPVPILILGDETELYWDYVGRTENVLYHPYQAAKSYEYGRKVRN